jgi:hypothetical protein
VNARSFVLASALAAATSTIIAAAQSQPTSPSTTETAQGPLAVVISGVEGMVQVRATSDAPWEIPKVGMTYVEGAEFRTGPKSAVRFVIPPDQTVTLDRLGTVKLLRANFINGKATTDLGMKYGRTRYDIEAAEREHDTRVRSPATVLTVRGTKVSLYDQPPFAPQAVSLTGRAEFKDLKKQVAFGGKGQGKTVISSSNDSSAELSLSQSYVDPTFAAARTPSEARLVEQVLSSGGTLSFANGSEVPIVRGGIPPSTAAIAANPPGALNFILRWTADADLNLTVAPIGLNEIVTPIFPLNQSASGGKTLFDHRGGPNGGVEVVFWPSNFPGHLPGPQDDITYVTSIDFISGVQTPVTLTTIVNGATLSVQAGTVSATGSNVQFIPTAAPSAARPANRKRK